MAWVFSAINIPAFAFILDEKSGDTGSIRAKQKLMEFLEGLRYET
jgi:hypothetical protein